MAAVGLSAAEQRREIRRQRILARSGDRMKKITGVNEPTVTFADEAPSVPDPYEDESAPHTPSRCHTERPLSTPIFNFSPNDFQTTDLNNFSAFNNTLLKETPETSCVEKVKASKPSSSEYESFVRWRCLMSVILGVLVRLSFCTDFGLNYVQSIFNPFMAWEIAAIGYQRALGMSTKGAVFNPILMMTLSQIKPEILETYKTITQVVTSVATDFAFFFFAFILLNLVL